MSPLNTRTFRAVMAMLMLGVLLVSGCSKKPVATPVPPPAPQETPAPTPTPTPAPTPPAETAPVAGIRSEDYTPAFFDYDSHSLRDDARTALDANAKLLRANPGVTITIEGHCDERGTVEYNQALGEKRAQSARDYLVAAGIEAGRISIVTYGKERPFATGTDEAAMQQNRRAHFVVRASS